MLLFLYCLPNLYCFNCCIQLAAEEVQNNPGKFVSGFSSRNETTLSYEQAFTSKRRSSTGCIKLETTDPLPDVRRQTAVSSTGNIRPNAECVTLVSSDFRNSSSATEGAETVRDDPEVHRETKPSPESSRACFDAKQVDATGNARCDIFGSASDVTPSAEGSHLVVLRDEDGSLSSAVWTEQGKRVVVGQPVAVPTPPVNADGSMLHENSSADLSGIETHFDNAYSASCSSSCQSSLGRLTSSPNDKYMRVIDSCGSGQRETARSPDNSLLSRRPPSDNDVVKVGVTDETTRVAAASTTNASAALESVHIPIEKDEIVAAGGRTSENPDDAVAAALVVAERTVYAADGSAGDACDVSAVDAAANERTEQEGEVIGSALHDASLPCNNTPDSDARPVRSYSS
jgi:hypothetical protein